MIFQYVLIIWMIVFLFYGIRELKISPLLAFFIIFLSVIGLVFSIFPDKLQNIAKFVGIGRGTDLLSYVFILFSFLVMVNLHLRGRALKDTITQLARALAIHSARTQSPPRTGGSEEIDR